ncbi:fido domain-containing protein [Lentinula edodes]|uniref:fido domain-containing protein n=1 Tax=Lentinula edodes TaxID=5353 RepID=UPI001E8EA50F|nr:fido domain-containing protein [Lentinula edodes]KAH7879591.1 fido domain-containing protein [Lentinula edodes]
MLQNIPDALTTEDATRLRDSFRVSPRDQVKCATSARLWEELLERYRLPFLLLRVADLRFITRGPGSQMTSLHLYVELGKMIQDEIYDVWLSQLLDSVTKQTNNMLSAYKSAQNITPNQHWRRRTSEDPFPYCRMPKAFIDELRQNWKKLSTMDSSVLSKFINLHCLETNVIEGTVQFDPTATTMLVQVGFLNEAAPGQITDSNIISGTVRQSRDALLILQDTHKAVDEIFELVKTRPVVITPEWVCCLHKKMMASSRVNVLDMNGNRKFNHITIGATRQLSCVNVAIQTSFQGRPLKVQFCPYDSVDAELATFCKQCTVLLERNDVDPFAAAAWISHIFITIHPFEDGNGRLSRMLASIPLLLQELPPICIGLSEKSNYNGFLNATRSYRNGDYEELMKVLHQGTLSSLSQLRLHLSGLQF